MSLIYQALASVTPASGAESPRMPHAPQTAGRKGRWLLIATLAVPSACALALGLTMGREEPVLAFEPEQGESEAFEAKLKSQPEPIEAMREQSVTANEPSPEVQRPVLQQVEPPPDNLVRNPGEPSQSPSAQAPSAREAANQAPSSPGERLSRVRKVREKIRDTSAIVVALRGAFIARDVEAAEAGLADLAAVAGEASPVALRMSAYWRLLREEDEEAARLYSRLLTLMPGDEEAGLNLALIDLRNGRREAALARAQRLAKLHPDSARVRDFLASARSLHD